MNEIIKSIGLMVILFLVIVLVGQNRWKGSEAWKIWMRAPMDTPQPNVIEYFEYGVGIKR